MLKHSLILTFSPLQQVCTLLSIWPVEAWISLASSHIVLHFLPWSLPHYPSHENGIGKMQKQMRWLGITSKETKNDWDIAFPLPGFILNSQMGWVTSHIRFKCSWWKWWTIHSPLPVMYSTVHQKHHHGASCVKPMKVSESSDMWNANCSPLTSTVFTWLILNGCISVLMHVEPV